MAGTPRRWVIGRAETCDIVVPVPEVSSRHCELAQSPAGFTVTDLGSANGTFVNGRRLRPAETAPVSPADAITLGVKTHFVWPSSTGAAHPDEGEPPPTVAVQPQADRAPAGPPGGQKSGPVAPGPRVVSFNGSALVLGRGTDCDEVLDDPKVSRTHARISRQDGVLVLENLSATNGTFVNGWRVAEPVKVTPGDVIGLGAYTFKLLDAGGRFESADLRADVTLEARDVGFAARKRPLIEGVSLTAFGGEFVGLMGPSGAGKSTLMNTLNGYTPPTRGRVFVNGHDLYRNYDWFRQCIGYVPQEDIMHHDLTVARALHYTARLRLPADFTREEIRRLVSNELKQLDLAGLENNLIKSLSGGQRRRVSLAMELLADPLILLLDEPTSGLSSEDSVLVMKRLRGLADQGKLIVLTIHQPSLEIYKMLDRVTVVAKTPNTADPGRLAYYGPAYPDAVTFFNPDGVPGLKAGQEPLPDEVLRGLTRRPAAEWVARYKASEYQKTYQDARAGTDDPDSAVPAPETAPVEGFRQFRTLVRRNLARKFADRIGTGILLLQAPAFAVLLVMVFGDSLRKDITFDTWHGVANSVSRVVFQLTLAAIWFGCSNAIREIVGEWAVYKRERMVNLKLAPYLASKFAVLGALSVVQCVVLLLVVHYGCGLTAPLGPTFALVLLASFVGVALGLLISAASRSNEVAIGLLPLVQLIMVVLGGGMVALHEMPKASQYIAQAMPSRWAFEGAMLMEAAERPRRPASPLTPPNAGTAPDMAEPAFPDADRTTPAAAFAALATMLVGVSGSVIAVLRLRDVH